MQTGAAISSINLINGLFCSMGGRIYRWDNLKFFMILGIILEHSLIIYDYPNYLEIPWALLISWLMPMFTIISGFWFKPKPIEEQATRLLHPMMLFSAVNFLCGYFFYPAYSGGFHLMGYAMWYLWVLFIFAQFTKWIIGRNISLSLILVISWIMVCGFCLLPHLGIISNVANELQVNRLISFYPFYLVGVILQRKERLLFSIPYRDRLIILALLVAGYLTTCVLIDGLAYKSGFYLSMGTSLVGILKFGISYLFIILICLSLISVVPNKEYKFSMYGARTMNVYLLHMLIVFPICWGFFYRHTDNVALSMLNIAIVPMSGLLLFSNTANKIIKAASKIKMGGVICVYIISLLIVNYNTLIKVFD